MSRPLRIEYPNACYHVINRGDNHRQNTSVHLFQGRYIPLNPVKTKKFSECSLPEMRNALRKFKWNSYPMLIGLKKQALIHYSEIYCRGRYSLTELSTKLNLSMGGYSSCCRSIRASLSKEKEFNARLKELKIKLDDIKC
jgi:hypothetical protein